MNLRHGFSRFLDADPERLHFAAHSHHPWPDVSYEAQRQAWVDAATLADDKWQHIFGSVIPATVDSIAHILGLKDSSTITFAPNTHAFLVRLVSCFEAPIRILTTDAEFHSFTRQARRWEEAGLAAIERVAAEPFDTFNDRFAAAAGEGRFDLVYLSEVFYNSGFVVSDLDRLVAAMPDDRSFFVIDGYHAFMARPVDLSAIQDRVFYIAGGYKYAMSGEGVCFMHCPPGYGERPIDTGWYAGFGQLESGVGDKVKYNNDGSRFFGATFDPSGIYRMDAVLDWVRSEEVDPKAIHEHAEKLQFQFLDNTDLPWKLTPAPSIERGNFLTFELEAAADVYHQLHARRVITDYRGDRLRFGFGVYHSPYDVEKLIDIVNSVAS